MFLMQLMSGERAILQNSSELTVSGEKSYKGEQIVAINVVISEEKNLISKYI